jgi:hypothetical protein
VISAEFLIRRGRSAHFRPAFVSFSQLADAVLFGLGYIGCSGTVRVPMLKVIRSFDGPEILLIAAASVLVASITFLL